MVAVVGSSSAARLAALAALAFLFAMLGASIVEINITLSERKNRGCHSVGIWVGSW
jgi:hypothetical protein